MSILIIAEDAGPESALRMMLEDGGYDDQIVSPTVAGVFADVGPEVLSAGTVDLILLEMVGGGGAEACRQLRETVPEVPVLLIVGEADGGEAPAALEAGATDLLFRPVRKMDLLARVRSALRFKLESDIRRAHETELAELRREVEVLGRELRRVQTQDALTGVADRHYFDEVLGREWRRAVRGKRELSILLLEIDSFKGFTDAYGHQAGDDCLKRVAAALIQGVNRPGDLVGRYGGERFVVLLPETPAEGAVVIADALRAAIETLGIVHGFSSTSDRVTISLGAATDSPSQERKPAGLLAGAERVLYRAAHEGGNRLFAATNVRSAESGAE